MEIQLYSSTIIMYITWVRSLCLGIFFITRSLQFLSIVYMHTYRNEVLCFCIYKSIFLFFKYSFDLNSLVRRLFSLSHLSATTRWTDLDVFHLQFLVQTVFYFFTHSFKICLYCNCHFIFFVMIYSNSLIL